MQHPFLNPQVLLLLLLYTVDLINQLRLKTLVNGYLKVSYDKFFNSFIFAIHIIIRYFSSISN